MRNQGLALGAAVVGICLLFVSLPASVLADGGMIPISDVLVYEPGQKAIIGWDGQNEVLILSTDVRGDSDTMALQVVPMPSQPESVEQGTFDSFERIGELLDDRFPSPSSWFDCGMAGEEGGDGVEIVFHEKIGAHDIRVVKAADAGELVEWAEDFLAQNEIEYEISSPELESVVGDYIEEGINFFVFDLIEAGSSPESVEPIVYSFKTDFLYYPLKMSSIIPGTTDITLFLLTPDPLHLGRLAESQPGGMKIARADDGKPIQCEIDQQELESIDQRLADLLGENAWLTTLESYGSVLLASLDEDVKLTPAFLGSAEKSEGSVVARLTWLWVLLGLAVLGLGWMVYVRRKRASQLRWVREYMQRLHDALRGQGRGNNG